LIEPPSGAVPLEEAVAWRDGLRRSGLRVAFTNGCFDLLHAGHVELLQRARSLGDALAVAVNGDASVRRLKGSGRPVVGEKERMAVLAALECVDYVVRFGEATPEAIIRAVRPQVLVKGGDWAPNRIVGSEIVRRDGGVVRVVPLRRGISTSRLIERILSRRRP
jgi:D-beta-D-heptose 7-phosphate kinase/D-beta-D-heptose 1-phosphate adenosyltransferase